MTRASSYRRRQARWWRTTSTTALAISVVFGALILTAAYSANERLSLFRFVFQFSGGGHRSGDGIASRDPVRLVGFSELDPRDPAVRFSDTRIGHVLFAVSQSDNCRRALFDNRTGSLRETKEIFCGQRPDETGEVFGSDRLAGLRQSFRRH
jgi:hypothetical protein